MATLHLTVGLPGAGKTTTARRLAGGGAVVRLTPDEWLTPLVGGNGEDDGSRDVMEGRLVWLAGEALSGGTSVVLDFGLWSRVERMALRSLAAEHGASSLTHYLPIDPDEQWRRVGARFTADPTSTYAMSRADLDDFRARFETPQDDELTSSVVDRPPSGFDNWRAWRSMRWPTSAG